MTDKDGRLKSESNSIGNQRELIRAFIHEQQDIELYDIYVDDGFSGSNFDRPEFKRMISDIEAGKVNCVIVKDLSRFGRDYIESGSTSSIARRRRTQATSCSRQAARTALSAPRARRAENITTKPACWSMTEANLWLGVHSSSAAMAQDVNAKLIFC